MSDGFPSQAQIVRVVRAAEKAGLPVTGLRVMPDGSVIVFASEAPLVDLRAAPGQDDPNDFD
jgi:hypothetical protein